MTNLFLLAPVAGSGYRATTTTIWWALKLRCMTRNSKATNTFRDLEFYTLSNCPYEPSYIAYKSCTVLPNIHDHIAAPNRCHNSRCFHFITRGRVSKFRYPADGFAYLLLKQNGRGAGILSQVQRSNRNFGTSF